jgi:heme a synthase
MRDGVSRCYFLESHESLLQLEISNKVSAMTIALKSIGEIETEQRTQTSNRRLVRSWLYFVLVTIFALVLVGGATRLTDSGLSITEWKPIHGIVPPTGQSQWEEEFAKYQQIPEYRQVNKGMTLDEFKTIFWWEWAHRFLARATGVVFAIPFLFFWLTRRLEPLVVPKLLGILALGGMQGLVGWWMVYSGLSVRTDVSQYRLAVHLTLACLIFAATTYVVRGLAVHTQGEARLGTQRFAALLVLMVLFQIYLGALVAGLDAGLAYNTWPLMDGALVPSGLLGIEPVWRNFFESAKTVQFVHRCGAYLLFIMTFAHLLYVMAKEPRSTHARRSMLLFALVTVQATIGIATLLGNVQIHTALLHQGMAIIVLFFAVAHWRATKGSYPLPTIVAVRS